MRLKAALLLLLAGSSLFAAQFENGQAARAVFGQPSFSARDAGVSVTSLVASGDRLYVAETSSHVLTFDLSRLADSHAQAAPAASGSCAVCWVTPAATAKESVMPGVAAVSVWNKAIAFADPANHRILLWRDSTIQRPDRGPDVVLGRLTQSTSSVGPATLVNPVSVALDGTRLFVGDAALHRVLVWNSLPVVDDQPADAVLGQPDFASSSVAESPGPETINIPAAMAADGHNLFVADSVAHRILVFSSGERSLAADAIVNSASQLGGSFAPGTLITIRGDHLGSQSVSASSDSGEPFPYSLDGVQVVMDGEALPLLAVAPEEVQAQIPYDLGGRSAAAIYLRVARGGSTSASTPAALKLTAAAPGLFALGGEEPRAGILLHGDEAENNGANGPPVTAENPARPGEVITIWATGLGAVSENDTSVMAGHPVQGTAAPVLLPVSAQIDGQAALVLSAKLPPGAVGVYEIRVVMPAGLPHGSHFHLSIAENGVSSNVVTFPGRAENHS